MCYAVVVWHCFALFRILAFLERMRDGLTDERVSIRYCAAILGYAGR